MQERGWHVHVLNSFFVNELQKLLHRLQRFWLDWHQCSTGGQGRQDLLQRSIKPQRHHLQRALAGSKLEFFRPPATQVEDRTMRNRHAFWLALRTRGVDHIGKVVFIDFAAAVRCSR